jgi:hypothetical protein
MAIPLVMILGLACGFYFYAAIQWCREAMMIRREGRRASSAIVLMFASSPEDGIAPRTRIGQTSSSERNISVMG